MVVHMCSIVILRHVDTSSAAQYLQGWEKQLFMMTMKQKYILCVKCNVFTPVTSLADTNSFSTLMESNVMLPQFHTFPHHWTVSLAKHSPMTFTNVLENVITVWNVKQGVGLHCI